MSNHWLPKSSEIEKIAQHFKLTALQTALLQKLRRHVNEKTPTCWKSQRTLAREMRCHRNTINRAVKELTRLGIIYVKERPRKTAHRHYEMGFKSNIIVLLKSTSVVNERHNSGERKAPEKSSESTTEVPESTTESTFESVFESTTTGDVEDEVISYKNKGEAKQEQLICDWTRNPDCDMWAVIQPYQRRDDLDKPRFPWFEKQLRDFYEKSIARNWSHHKGKPGTGFRKTFFRAGRDNVLGLYGFNPKTPEQIAAEEADRERLAAEQQRREKERLEQERRKREEEQKRLVREEKLEKQIRERCRKSH